MEKASRKKNLFDDDSEEEDTEIKAPTTEPTPATEPVPAEADE